MIDFLIGFAFVAMIVAPAIAAAIQRGHTGEDELPQEKQKLPQSRPGIPH